MNKDTRTKTSWNRRQVLIGVSGTLGVLATPSLVTRAFAASPAELAEAARQEGQLTIYTSANVERQTALNEGFTKKYGVNVQVQRLLGAELDHKVQAELTADQHVVDVMGGTSPLTLADFKERGWLLPIADEELTSTDVWPERYWNGYWASGVVNFFGIAYNSENVPADKIPKTWQDMLDPFWTGQLLLLDPDTGVQSQLQWAVLHKAYGADFLKQLRAQGDLTPSGVPALQAVGAGAALAYLYVSPPPFQAAKNTGLPLEIVFPTPTTRSGIFFAAIAGSPHPNAAKLYVDYVMTAEGQSFINGGGGYSPIADVPGTNTLPSDIEDPDYEYTLAHAAEIIAALK